MTFQEFAINQYDQNRDWIAVALILIAAASVVGIYEGITRRKLMLSISAGVVLLGMLVGVVNIITQHSAIMDQNETIAENNLKQKYDIEKVLWEESSADPQSTDPGEKITIQDKNSNILKFRYEINEKTREPYLLNDPDFTQVKSNDLLRTKSE